MSTVSSRSLVAGRVEILRSEWTWLALASAGIAVFYLALRAPALNPGTFTDPWFYTALMVNFKYLFHTFSEAYDPMRLPWLIPGIAAHSLFGPATAFFGLHARSSSRPGRSHTSPPAGSSAVRSRSRSLDGTP